MRLDGARIASGPLIQGWCSVEEGLKTFTEAPLELSPELSPDGDPRHSPILLVSAPGAVGKSTLARQIAFVTGAVYVDLAVAEPVGANTVTGGLVKSELYQSWTEGSTALLVDALDEARLRATQEGFEAFLYDVAATTRDRNLPTVLFGRTGAVEDAWIAFADAGIKVPVLEIGFYGVDASVAFVEAMLDAANPNRQHTAVERSAVEALLGRLRDQTESDGDRFAGYAPVLGAVAERVAKNKNPGRLVAEINSGAEPISLRTVVSAILERERGKIKKLPLEDDGLLATLYSPGEQLDRLAARLYGGPLPDLPPMSANDAQVYHSALDTWVSEHPFVGTSSSVFDAMISTHALKNPVTVESVLRLELSRGAAANPFLAEFYGVEDENTKTVFLRPEHVGIVYASLRARLSLGDTASLLVAGQEDAEEEEALRAEVEISFARRGEDKLRTLHFHSDQTGPVRLGIYVEDVDIAVPYGEVEIGPGTDAVLIAPVNIQCAKLTLAADRIIVESASGKTETAAVLLEAREEVDGGQMISVPVLRGGVSLAAAWPGVHAHPWISFATDPTPIADPRISEVLRRLRQFVLHFRSHGSGRLARFRAKIEHARMTKGSGQAVLDMLLADGILSQEGLMYFLDTDRLVEQTGINYVSCTARQFGPQAVAFANRVLEAAG